MFVIIPLKNGEKIPKYCNWQNTTETDYDSLFNVHNTGILCGKVGNITVLDVDVKNGKLEDANKFIEKWDLFNICSYIVRTTSGGYHFYFNYTSELVKSSPSIDGVKFLDIMTETSKNTPSFVVAAGSKVNDKMYTITKNKQINNIPENLLKYLIQITSKKDVKFIDNSKYEQYLLVDGDKEKILKCLKSKPINEYANDYHNWSLITGILKKYNLFDEWIEFSKQSDKFDAKKDITKWNESNNNVKVDIHYLSYLYNTVHFNKINFSCKMHKKITSYPEDTLFVNSKYITNVSLDNVINSEKCILIKSHMNSGKTTLIRNFVNNNNYNLISVCPRISLVDDMFNNMQNNSSKKYNHYKNSKKGQNIFTTIDSLNKIEINDYKNIFLYLDEISALLYYIQSVQYSNSNTMLNALIKICKMATKIICTDADINDCVLNFFSMIDIDYKLVYNEYDCPIIGKHYACTEEDIFKQIKKDVLNQNHIFATSDRKNTTNIIYMFLRSIGVDKDDILLINRDETEKNKELYDTKLWHNKHIIISPSITIGVDFVPENARNVYSIIGGGSINPISICQQIFRCRKIIDIYTCIKVETQQPTMFNIKQVSNIFDNIKPVELYENAHNEDIFNYLLAYHIYADDLLNSNYKFYISLYLYEKGFNGLDMKIDDDDISSSKNNKNEFENELAKNEFVEEANKLIKQYNDDGIDLLNYATSNPIIKRLQILNIPSNMSEKYKEVIYDESKFKKHILCSQYIDMIENPNKIKSKFLNKCDYQNKLFKSNLGKIELLRRIYYNEDVETNIKSICQIQRIKIPKNENNKQFVYKIIRSLGCDIIHNAQKDIKKKALYEQNNDIYNYNKELKNIRKNPINNLFIDTTTLDNI